MRSSGPRIEDPFANLDEDERSRRMAEALRDSGVKAANQEDRILLELVQIISELTEDGKTRLDLLAGHLDRNPGDTECWGLWKWPSCEAWRDITRLEDFPIKSGSLSKASENDSGTSERRYESAAAGYLDGLKSRVREKAVDSLFGDTTHLQLPAEFCEFKKQRWEIWPRNWDRLDPMTSFASTADVEDMDEMALYLSLPDDHDIAAGWCAGKDYFSRVYHLLCRPRDDQTQPWQRKIEVGGTEYEVPIFDSLSEFLDWYADYYARFSRPALKKLLKSDLENYREWRVEVDRQLEWQEIKDQKAAGEAAVSSGIDQLRVDDSV